MAWYSNNSELDSTIRMLGGFAVIIILIIGMFIGEFFFDKTYFDETILHAIIVFTGGWIAGAKFGSGNGNGDKK